MKKLTLILIFLLVPANLMLAQIVLPGFYGNNMVLQQNEKLRFWGWSGSKENSSLEVLTTWDKKTYNLSTGENGRWSLTLVTPSAGGPYEIIIKDQTEKLKVRNIMFGEVWFCSGQSNMAMTLNGMENQPILNSDSIIAEASNSDLRLLTVERKHTNKPQENIQGEWTLTEPENVRKFSAVAYQFGQILQKELEVPVGIIVSSWGGTPIRSWMDDDSMKSFPKMGKKRNGKAPFRNPSVLYNAMIAPLTVYPVAGFLWYQGEADRRDSETYQKALPEMVENWRSAWGQDELPFYYVQIAPFHYNQDNGRENAPYLREAQLKAAVEIPNSGMIVTADIGSNKTIHPPDKTTVAERLANYALGQTYRRDNAYKSPKFDYYEVKGKRVFIHFENGKGLNMAESNTNNYEVAGADGTFFPAKARINNDILILESEKVKNPRAARYGFKNYFEGNLFNGECLPASPFRTDDWPSQKYLPRE